MQDNQKQELNETEQGNFACEAVPGPAIVITREEYERMMRAEKNPRPKDMERNVELFKKNLNKNKEEDLHR